MDKEQARKRIEVLRKEIDENRYLYHVLDKPRVSDAVDDSLKRELAKLEEQFPDLVTPDSPTQRIGGKPLDKFKKVRHRIPMLSLNDAFSEDDLKAWEQRLIKLAGEKKIKNSGFYCELKMDGLAVSLQYQKGVLTVGTTRGDGQIGEDVTNNLKTVESVPLKLRGDVAEEIEVRGEVYLPKKDFEKLNEEQKKKGGQIFANPRNISAGSIRQLDPKITASRNLQFMMYSIPTRLDLQSHHEEHDLAKKLGFKTSDKNKVCKDINEVLSFLKHWEKARQGLPFQTDGVVVGVDDKKVFEQLGVVGKAPRGRIAYKFAAEEATSQIKDIVVQVGRTGKLTPVAHLEPTLVAGSTISRATLHNADEIKRKDIKIGDTVVIHKAGDVIPEVKEVIKRMRSGDEKEFHMPKECPICGGKVIKREGEVDWYCADRDCSVRVMRSIGHFVSKGAFEIDGLGPKIIQKLIEVGLVKDATDIFDLKQGDLEPLERFAEKSAQNLVESIEASKEISLDRFIYSLGIRHVGSVMAQDLARQFGTLEKFTKACHEDFDRMYGVGGKVADSIIEFLEEEKNLRLIEKMQKLGVKIKSFESAVKADKLKDQSFVVTGSLETMTREEAHKKIIQYGGEVHTSVSSQTNFLIVGEEPGSKLDKAKKLGVKQISEKNFLEMIS
ncbi:MAG: NAD-dependent DNA ligase LigA [Candidatus Berkelbacteria bacterium]|nr:NAD-dependent DNA ligase LigA [Candidatus Berkelbacteria bacterium]